MAEMSVIWLRVAAGLYSLGLLHAILTLVRRREHLFRVALGAFALGSVFHFVSIVEEGVVNHRFPIANFYETLSMCAFLIAVLYLLVHWRYKVESLSVFIFPLVFVMALVATLGNPVSAWSSPVVRNAWLTVHIVLVLLGYAALLFTAVASVAYLFQEHTELNMSAVKRAEVTGRCALCSTDAVLKHSHLLPQALYRFVRAKDGPNSSPIVINRDAAWTTDKQITKPLLCSACEQRFHKEGEDWTVRQIYRGGKRFRLLDALNSCTHVAKKPEFAVYALSDIPNLRVHDLSYFAVSVFWKAAATDWKICGQSLPRPTFGAKYMAAFSHYLLGRAGFPSNAAIQVEVCDNPTIAATTLMTPAGAIEPGFDHYQFLVPGVRFHLFLGESIPPPIQSCCIVTGEHPAVFRRNYEQLIQSKFALFMTTARIPVGLKDEMTGLGGLNRRER